MKTQAITKDDIYSMADKGIFLYQSGDKVLFKIDIDKHPQRSMQTDNYLRARIDSRHDEICELIRNMMIDIVTIKQQNGSFTPAQWELARLWRLIDFTPILRFMCNKQLIQEREFDKFTEADFESVGRHLTRLVSQFGETYTAQFLKYMEHFS